MEFDYQMLNFDLRIYLGSCIDGCSSPCNKRLRYKNNIFSPQILRKWWSLCYVPGFVVVLVVKYRVFNTSRNVFVFAITNGVFLFLMKTITNWFKIL